MSDTKLEAWGIVELMGHQRTAGRLTEQNIAGANLLRVDVPMPPPEGSSESETFRTVFYGSSAIYAVHITDEAAARVAAKAMGAARPTYAWELERTSRLPAPQRPGDDDVDSEF